MLIDKKDWITLKLSEVASINELSLNREYPWETINYIDTSSVTSNVFQSGQLLDISDAPSRARRIVRDGDTIISTVRPIQRHFGYIRNPQPNTICSTGFAVVSPKNIDPEFLYYYLTQDSMTEYLNTIAESTTSTFPAFRPEELADLDIHMPKDLETQRWIGQFLSVFDQKIELNRRMNETLEAIAQAIFKEWFVDFNYPGATGKLVPSPLGPIPEGWAVGSIDQIAVFDNLTVSPGNYPGEVFNHYSLPAFDNNQEPIQQNGSEILSNKFIIQQKSILISKLNPRIPRIWVIDELPEGKNICSTEFMVTVPKMYLYFEYLATLLSQNKFLEKLQLSATGTSSSHQRISPSIILNTKILIPDRKVINLFTNIVGAFRSKKTNNAKETSHLRVTRDLLTSDFFRKAGCDG